MKKYSKFDSIVGTSKLNKVKLCYLKVLGKPIVCATEVNRTRKLQTPTSSYLTTHRKGSARGTVYRLAHACDELARQLG